VLHAGPPAGVRVPSGAVSVDRDPAVLMQEHPDERVRVDRVPARAHVEAKHRIKFGSKVIQIRTVVPATFTMVSSTNMRCASPGVRAEGSKGGTEPLHLPPYRRIAPHDDVPQGLGGVPEGNVRVKQVNRVDNDRKGSPSRDPDWICVYCGVGGGLPSGLCSSIGLGGTKVEAAQGLADGGAVLPRRATLARPAQSTEPALKSLRVEVAEEDGAAPAELGPLPIPRPLFRY